MSSKPRQSILNLFDPLLTDALHVPLPDTPPSSPRCQEDENDGENRASGDAMSLFFDSFMKANKTRSSTKQNIELLINIEEEDAEAMEVQEQPTTPLTMDKTMERQPHVQASSILNFSQDTESTYDPVIPPLLVLSEATETPNALLTEESQPTPDPQAVNDDYSLLPFQPHSRRRSSIDIPRTISSFSSGLLEPGGSNFDLIQEELSLLSAFSEDGEADTSQNLNNIELPPFPVQEVADITSPLKPTLSTPISAAFQKHFKLSGELPTPETETVHQKQYPQVHLNKGSYGMNDSNCQLIDSKGSSTPSQTSPPANDTPSNSQVTTAISAPKRPKVFTLNRQYMFKPNLFLKSADKTENMGNNSSKPASSLAQTRMIPLEASHSGNVPVRAIPRLHKAPSVQQTAAPESKIPSRVTAQTDGSNHYKSTPTYNSFGGASRIAVPLKKGLRKT